MKSFKGWLAEKKTKVEIGKPDQDSEVLVVSDIVLTPVQTEAMSKDKGCYISAEALRQMAKGYNRLSNLQPY